MVNNIKIIGMNSFPDKETLLVAFAVLRIFLPEQAMFLGIGPIFHEGV